MIYARKIQKEELLSANIISKIAFHGKAEDMEQLAQDHVKDEGDQWAALAEDGTMITRVINYRCESYINGNIVNNGGIGSVSTLYEYRGQGGVRTVFEKLIPEAREHGEIISTLYPFNHAFYRKFGYETVCTGNIYSFAPEVLSEYRFRGKAVPYKKGDPVSAYTALYQDFAKTLNLMMLRNDEFMEEEVLTGTPLANREFTYLLKEDGEDAAYLVFKDIRHDPAAILEVTDLAYRGRKGFLAILGFLARFSADYGEVRLKLPSDVEFLSLIHSSKAYSIKKSTRQDYMIRVMNTEKLLLLMQIPASRSLVIRVTGDDLIPENNGTWRVTETEAVRTEASPDMEVSIRALGQMAAGAVGFQEAVLREDVEIYGNEETLREVFVRKGVFILDHF